jgi:hypothetical protein
MAGVESVVAKPRRRTSIVKLRHFDYNLFDDIKIRFAGSFV